MAEILDFKSIKGLYDELVKDVDLTKEHPEKFMGALVVADSKNLATLKKFNITLRPSNWLVLAMEPETLEKNLVRAESLGFLDAYLQNPSFIKVDVDKIVKRIGECEAYGVAYKSDKGKYQSWLFSDRGYAFVMQGKTKEEAPLVSEEISEIAPANLAELTEYANRVVETFGLEDERANIYNSLNTLATTGMNAKEILMEAFKSYADNLDFLSISIDEILASYEEEKGRVA